jgi:hypothetical protein
MRPWLRADGGANESMSPQLGIRDQLLLGSGIHWNGLECRRIAVPRTPVSTNSARLEGDS